MDAESFAGTQIDGRGFQCDACGEYHPWHMADATLQAEQGPCLLCPPATEDTGS